MASTFTPELVPSQPITTDDLERDRVFSQRVRLFGWIREKHLDVPEGEAAQGFLGFAEQGVCVCVFASIMHGRFLLIQGEQRVIKDQPLQGATR